MSDNFMERSTSKAVQTVESKEIAEIKAKMFLAREFPRDIKASINNIKVACANPKLAETAIYSYPKGDQEVKGASIRLAEAVAQNWGNFLCGVKELERTDKDTTVSVFAWDLETNFQDEKRFEIQFVRNTRKGSYWITDEREKYEMMANYAARRKRACILAVIPQYVFDIAMQECETTLENALKGESIEESKAKMLEAYKAFGDWITESHFETLLGKSWDAVNVKDLVKMRNLYSSIKDGFVSASVALGNAPAEGSEQMSVEEEGNLKSVADKVRKTAKKATAPETNETAEQTDTAEMKDTAGEENGETHSAH